MYYRFLLLLIISVNAIGQGNIPIGTWRTHLSYNSVETVEVAGDRVYAGSSSSAFYLENGVFNELSKLTGLSDINVTKIRFHEKSNTVVFGYENGNIDLIINKNTIVNLNDILRADIQGSKQINEIHFHENLAFLSTDFGVVVVDLLKKEIKETYQNFSATTEIIKVNATTVFSDSIYVCTRKGLFVSKYSNTNLMDFSTWKKVTPMPNLAGIESMGAAVYKGQLYISFRDNGILLKDGQTWRQSPARGVNGPVALGMRTLYDKLIYCGPIVHYIKDDNLIHVQPTSDFSRDVAYSSNGDLYVADIKLGLMKYSNVDKSYTPFIANGPFSAQAFNLYESGGHIYKLAGAYSSNIYEQIENQLPYDKFTNGSWENNSLDNKVNTLVDMAYNPTNGKYYYCSYVKGLIVQSPSEIKIFAADNSPLKVIPPSAMVRASAVAVAEDGNIWVGTYNLPEYKQLFKLDVNDNFVKEYFLTSQQNSPLQIIIDDNNLIWIRGSAKIISILNEQTNSWIYSTQIGGLKNPNVTTLAKDKKGEIWVGTEGGVAVYSDPGLLSQAKRPTFTYPYYAGFSLLYDKIITSIKVDAANRKWIGTTSGLWLMNESGTELVQYFNTDNSPLLSNNIIDIEIEPISGEVFIATDKGLISYRGDATKVNDDGKFENVNIFPNPIKPGYTGEVAISGLAVNETNVKITDVFGNLVYETKSTGGTATWNLMDYNGKKAKPGMYLVFNITPDGIESMVSKMAIVD